MKFIPARMGAVLALLGTALAIGPSLPVIASSTHGVTVIATGITNDSGAWSASGAINDEGTWQRTDSQINANTGRDTIVLSGRSGTFTIKNWVIFDACFCSGTGAWTVVGGTGTYQGMRGGGRLVFSGDTVVLKGKVHLRERDTNPVDNR